MQSHEHVVMQEKHSRWRRIVREAEAMLLRCDRDAPRIVDVCRRLGVSARGLHDAFAHVHGVSPGRWLRDRRLVLVHEALRAAPERRSAVKRAALALGFRHLGHVSRAYRERFGELPSETIARGLAGDDGDGCGEALLRFTPPGATARPAPPAP